MENLTCDAYLANPDLRQQMEQQARRERAEAVHGFFIAPLKRIAKRMFRRTRPVAVRPMHVAA